MKQIFILFILLFFSLSSQAQKDTKIVLGRIDSIPSKILNEQRKIWVYVPNNGDGSLSKQRYPVVYLLDGDAHFYSVAGMAHQLSSVNGNTICPEMIIVGIPNTNRTRDLTPTHVAADPPFLSPDMGRESGGGEQFTAFLEKELIPYIDATYPTAPYRMLIGHSFGGLTVINTLVHHTKLFNAYVAIDPSMSWDHKKLVGQAKEVLARQNFTGTSLYLAAANTMRPGMDIANVKKDTTAVTKHIRAILELSEVIKANTKSGLKYRYKYYNDDDHGSVPLIAEYDALHFIFDYYRLPLTLDDHLKMDMGVLSKMEKHYEMVSKNIGYKVAVPEDVANGMGYQALGAKHYTEAEYLFKMNVANYPTSSNVYDSLGDFYKDRGDNAKAIDLYKKALTLSEVADTRQKLEELQGK